MCTSPPLFFNTMENSVYPMEDFFEFNGLKLASIKVDEGYFPVMWVTSLNRWIDFSDLATFDSLQASRNHIISKIKSTLKSHEKTVLYI